MVSKVLNIGDWIQQKVKSKSGIFVLGMLLGSLPIASVTYVIHKDSQRKDNIILSEHERYRALEDEKDVWQERAFNAETTCLTKIKEMAVFFQDLKGMYKKQDLENRENIADYEDQLSKYEDISNRLTTIKTQLDNEE